MTRGQGLGIIGSSRVRNGSLLVRRLNMKLVNVNNNSEQDYRQFLKDLECSIFNEYPIIGLANAKLIVTKADFEKHSYSEYEVEMYAYDLAGFVADCIKNTRLS